MGQSTASKPNANPRVSPSWRVPVLMAAAWFPLLTALLLAAHAWLRPWLATSFGSAIVLAAGVGAVACQGVVLWRFVKCIRPAIMIQSAVASWRGGEADAQLLTVADDGTGLSEDWNRMMTAWGTAQTELKSYRTATSVVSNQGGEAGYSAVFDMLPNGVMIIDRSGKVSHANAAASRVFMRSQERMKDAPLTALIDQTELSELVAATLNESRARGGQVELTIPQTDEHEAVIRFIIRPMGSQEDRRALVVMNDVTHQRVADKSRNLFVAQATHELRTPLTNIGLYLERAIDLTDDQFAERSECLNVINGEVGRLARVVEEFLSVSEIEAGSFQVRRDDVRVDELVKRMQDEYMPQAKAKSLDITFDLPPKLSVVQGDREKVSLAIHNLIGNAIKYTPAGQRVRVEVGEDPAAGHVEVRVSDTGIGIGEEDLPKVFEKFYRANDERLSEIKGSGLGLALAREVIRLHGGDITCESTLNEGTTFTLTLPLHHPAKTA